MPGRLVLKLLGPPRIDRDGRAVSLDTRKATALIAYLAVTGQPQARDAIAVMLWPDADGERARGALRRTLSTLRTGLGGDELRTDGLRIALDEAAIDVDVRRFRALVADGRLEEAVAAYTGDFLSGFSLKDSVEFDAWQAAQAEQLRGELASVLGRLALGTSDAASAIVHARRWISVDPLQEPAHRALMRLLANAGDRSGALLQYRECAHLLDRELGVTPLPETTALRDAIERGEETPEPQSRPAALTVHETVGDLYTLHGDYAKAISSYASAAAESAGTARATVEHKLANVHHRRGEWQEAERHYRAALLDAEMPAFRARVSADWSLAVYHAGNHAQATRLAQEALSLAEHAHDDRALAQAHNILGILTGESAHLEHGLAIAERIGDASIRVAALNNLALACGRAGEHARAIALNETALAAGRGEDAMRHLKRAVTLFAGIGEPGAMEPEVWKLVEW